MSTVGRDVAKAFGLITAWCALVGATVAMCVDVVWRRHRG